MTIDKILENERGCKVPIYGKHTTSKYNSGYIRYGERSAKVPYLLDKPGEGSI